MYDVCSNKEFYVKNCKKKMILKDVRRLEQKWNVVVYNRTKTFITATIRIV